MSSTQKCLCSSPITQWGKNSANVTDASAISVHGTNPQNLIEKILRSKIYNHAFWKEHCFGLTAESLVDKAMEIEAIGGTFGGIREPSKFIMLMLKMLQIQPEKEIVVEFIKNEDYKYVRALGAFYMRLTGKPVEVYQYLEPLYNDYRKLRRRLADGSYTISRMDEFIEECLREDYLLDIALPHLPARVQLEQSGQLAGPRRSALEEELDELEAEEAKARAASEAAARAEERAAAKAARASGGSGGSGGGGGGRPDRDRHYTGPPPPPPPPPGGGRRDNDDDGRDDWRGAPHREERRGGKGDRWDYDRGRRYDEEDGSRGRGRRSPPPRGGGRRGRSDSRSCSRDRSGGRGGDRRGGGGADRGGRGGGGGRRGRSPSRSDSRSRSSSYSSYSRSSSRGRSRSDSRERRRSQGRSRTSPPRRR